MPETNTCLPVPSPEALSRRIARLERRIAALQEEAKRFSWYRLAAFLLGAAALWAAGASLPPPAPALVFLGAALVFALIVTLHRRLDRLIQRFSLWSQLLLRERSRPWRQRSEIRYLYPILMWPKPVTGCNCYMILWWAAPLKGSSPPTLGLPISGK